MTSDETSAPPEVAYGIIAVYLVTDIIMLFLMWNAVRYIAAISQVPRAWLLSTILMMSDGNVAEVLARPYAMSFLIVSLSTLLWPLIMGRVTRRRHDIRQAPIT